MTSHVSHVVSLSNASLDLYPSNSLSRFTHRLPQPIEVPKGLRAYAALTKFTISTKLPDDHPEVGFVKIHLRELDPVAVPDEEESRVLSRAPWKHRWMTWCSKEYPTLCPISCTDKIEELSFLFTDEHNKQLPLLSGPTTLVQLMIIMTDAHASFTMTVSTNTSKDLFSHNKPATFEVELPDTFRFRDHWEVALLAAQVDKSLHLENIQAKFVLHNGRQVTTHRSNPFAAHEDDIVLTVPVRHKAMPAELFVTKHVQPWLDENGIELTIDDDNGAYLISHKPDYVPFVSDVNSTPGSLQGLVTLEMSPTALKLMAVDTTSLQEYDDHHGAVINLPQDDTSNKRIVRYFAHDHTVPKGIQVLDHLAVYCDLVERSVFGNEIAHIMDVLPTKKLGLLEDDKAAFYSVRHPVFRRINPHMRKTFSVALRSLDGSVPPLKHDSHDDRPVKHPIYLTFAFRWRD